MLQCSCGCAGAASQGSHRPATGHPEIRHDPGRQDCDQRRALGLGQQCPEQAARLRGTLTLGRCDRGWQHRAAGQPPPDHPEREGGHVPVRVVMSRTLDLPEVRSGMILSCALSICLRCMKKWAYVRGVMSQIFDLPEVRGGLWWVSLALVQCCMRLSYVPSRSRGTTGLYALPSCARN